MENYVTLEISENGTLLLDGKDNITVETGGIFEFENGTVDIIN